jgi:nucleotide-binding universal stress UspA family protein
MITEETIMTTKIKHLKKILCPVDFSAASEQALKYAAELHGDNGELIVLHVCRQGAGDGESQLKEHLSHFSRYSDLLSALQCPVRFAVEYGNPAAAIIDYAGEHEVDFIVIGSHGTTNLQRLLVGSTAESVMRHAPCPVVILKSPEPKKSERKASESDIPVMTNTND